jgi:sugar lactone lactonase YvrE
VVTIDLDAIEFVGAGLSRPECVLTTLSGDLFVSDRRGGVSVVRPDGSSTLIEARGRPEGFLPNGIALLPDRDILIANLSPPGGVWRLKPDGQANLHLSEVDGRSLPPINFVGLDRAGRIWITVSTRLLPREKAFRKDQADGFIIVQDVRGPRIVADGLGYTNEAIVDPTGRWLYVNETVARRTSRFPIHPDASLGEKEVVAEYPPATFPDGLAFDAEGGVWIVSVASNRVIRVAPDGSQQIVLEDADPEVLGQVAEAYDRDRFGRDEMDAGRSRPLGNLASIAFGGDDLRKVYLGSLHGERLASFRSPIAGAEPVHWTF